jgi:predicted TIM-barrel fold metal-dependent hydrolase
MSGHTDQTGAEVRAQLDHPVIDADGHIVECESLVNEYVWEIGGPAILERWMTRPARYGKTKMMWWGLPSGSHTADRAMSMLPRYFAARMDECGIDFAHMLSTIGIPTLYTIDDELRVIACRAVNRMYADIFADVADRVRPVALVPTYTPEEAIRELEYAVLELGHKAVMIGTEIRKPSPEGGERWQSIAIDAPHDYDPFWQRCVELGVAPICHTSQIGSQTRQSPTNYVYNHLGMFASGAEHFCRALFMGGVTRRFPTLNFGLLEGGAAWAVTLLNDIVEHFEKRNVTDLLANLDPDTVDVEVLAALFERYGDDKLTSARIRLNPNGAGNVVRRPELVDEFADCGMTEVADLRGLFCERFYFGCEADDRMQSVAFNRRLSPIGVPLRPVLGSDIGHWDVMDARTIVAEAYSLVEAQLLTPADFRQLTFVNPVLLHAGMNRNYYTGTVIEAQVERLLAGMPAPKSPVVA